MLRISTNTDKIIGQISKYLTGIPEKQRRFLEELARLGIDTAKVNFRNAVYDGTNDVVVSETPQWEDENTLVISASGTTILFIEFGTGVRFDISHPVAGELGMTRGSYGKGHGKQPGGWVYIGEPGTNGQRLSGDRVHTYGNPANRSMYDAGREMRTQISEIARRIWNSND